MSEFKDVIRVLDCGQKADPHAYARVRGDQLTPPVVWQGRQWAVTGYGLECRDGTYSIEAHRLWEEEGTYGWIRHLAEKAEWVDIEDFIVGLGLARTYHQRLVLSEPEVSRPASAA